MDYEPIPDTLVERAELLKTILLLACEYKKDQDHTYQALRREFMRDLTTKPLLPKFVRTSRDLGQFWEYIRDFDWTYAGRRKHVREALDPLFEYLEARNAAPEDAVASDVLIEFDPDSGHSIWRKAFVRLHADPEGAIKASRTLLEVVCKHILDKTGTPYRDNDDLSALYRATAMQLDFAPSRHTEEVYKQLLDGVTAAVEGLSAPCNQISDTNGRGSRGVTLPPHHAQLAVNLAGALATFLIEAWLSKTASC